MDGWMDHPKVNKSQLLPVHSLIIPMPILQKQERGHSKNEVSSCYLVSILAHKIFILNFEYPFYSKWTKKIKSTIKWRDYRCGKLNILQQHFLCHQSLSTVLIQWIQHSAPSYSKQCTSVYILWRKAWCHCLSSCLPEQNNENEWPWLSDVDMGLLEGHI